MRRLLTVLSVLAIIGGTTIGFGSLAGASASFCVGDNVVPGGVSSASGVAAAYGHPRVSHVYKYFGISQQDINNLDSQSAMGTVTKSGNIILHGKVVATHAISAGCGFIPGSTKVNDGYMTFYTRPTSVSFAKSSLSAMVVMQNKSFAFAILTSCGNPVKATPVKHQKTVVITKTVTPPTQTQTQTVVVNNTPPPQVKAAQASTLPNTGPGNVIGISAATIIVGSVGHYFYRRRYV